VGNFALEEKQYAVYECMHQISKAEDAVSLKLSMLVQMLGVLTDSICKKR
jgi:hypothetical protein